MPFTLEQVLGTTIDDAVIASQIEEVEKRNGKPIEENALSVEERNRIITEWYRTFRQKVFWMLLGMCRNYHDAEEHTHDGFVRVIEKFNQFDQRRKPQPWILRVIRNTYLDYTRRKSMGILESDLSSQNEEGERSPFLSLIESTEETPLDILLKQEERALVQNAIDMLPEKYRAVIVLRDFDKMKFDAIASALNRKKPTIIWRYSEAIQKLKWIMRRLKVHEYEDL